MNKFLKHISTLTGITAAAGAVTETIESTVKARQIGTFYMPSSRTHRQSLKRKKRRSMQEESRRKNRR